MMSFRKQIIFYLLAVFYFGYEFECKCSHQKILLISIPKCGTWLLDKTASLLTSKKNALWRFIDSGILVRSPIAPATAIQLFTPSLAILEQCTNINEDEYVIAHMVYKKEFEEILIKNGFKIIFIIRDPRDQIISRVFYVMLHKGVFSGLQQLSFNELLEGFLGVGSEGLIFEDLLTSHINYKEIPKHRPLSNIKQFYDCFLGWAKSNICFMTTFEKLIGSKGGGDDKVQSEELNKIAKFLELDISQEKKQQVCSELFGNSFTFREGKIGSWKKYFSNEHKRECKTIAGQLLIDLGYEKDFNW